MFKKGLLFGLGWFIAKDIVQNQIPETMRLFTNGCFINFHKKRKSGEIKTFSEAVNYVKNYDETDPNKTEIKSKNVIGF